MSVNQNLSLFAKTLNANGHIDSSEHVIVANNFFFANGDPVTIEGALLSNNPVFAGLLQGPDIDVSGNVEAANVTVKGTTTEISLRNQADAEIAVLGHDGTDLVIEAQTDIIFSDIGGADMSGKVYIKTGGGEQEVWHAGNDGTLSGMDADLLDGNHGAYYLDAGNLTGTVGTGALSGTYSINITGSADTVDGLEGTDLASNNYFQAQLGDKLDSSTYTASDVLTKIKTVDGTGSGLDADTLDGLEVTDLASNNFINATRDVYQHTSVTKTFTVTVSSKSSSHRYNGTGSGNGYLIDGVDAPIITLLPGSTYRFDQADSSNSGHPLRFYVDVARTTSWTDGVTTNGTPGTAGAYTEITVAENTPFTLAYQCSSHSYMGNAVNIIGLETEALLIKDSAGSTIKTIRGV